MSTSTPVYTYTYDHIHVRTKDPEGMANFFETMFNAKVSASHPERRRAHGLIWTSTAWRSSLPPCRRKSTSI